VVVICDPMRYQSDHECVKRSRTYKMDSVRRNPMITWNQETDTSECGPYKVDVLDQ